MKLKFTDQQYQTDAVNSIVDIFDGSEVKDNVFTIDISKGQLAENSIVGKGVTYQLGFANKLTLDDTELLNNVRKIQERNSIIKSTSIQGRNFTIEMETGTGKTYVYTKTILELHKKYGFTKFIIVVPNIAIKEGIYKSFQITEDHFKLKYDNEIYNYFIYDSLKLTQVQTFATNNSIEIMIINIDSFKKSFDDPSKENKSNIIHRESDRLSGNKPIDLISSTNPIVIIDEPQSVDNTPKAKEAIKSLKPMCILRYSATHKETYNLMYRLTPVDAYQENLVKHIEVSSISSDEVTTKAYIKVISVDTKKSYSAKVEIFVKSKDGSLSKKVITTKPGEDLWQRSGEVDYYQESNYTVDDIGTFDDVDYVRFANGIEVNRGESIGEINQDVIKRAQIRETIDLHLKKEEKLLGKGIKVLSLFFIDQVDKYRIYEGDEALKGQYAKWFEEEFNEAINNRFKRLKATYSNQVSFNAEKVHDGYFSVDKKGKVKDTKGDSSDDESTYELIMKNKEKLLSFSEPTRFIFSHSALKEGWDNPNVFQVCTLVETKDTMTKRQKIGRGLRICVNQDGERVYDSSINTLSVIANESYKDFAGGLQKEMENDYGYKFGIIEKDSFTNIEITNEIGQELSLNQDDSVIIFNHLLKQGYVKTNGKVEDKFYLDIKAGILVVPTKYEVFGGKIINAIQNLSKNIEIKDAKERIRVKINSKAYLSEQFADMWNRIKRKTIYSVDMDLVKFINESIEKVKNMPKIDPEKVYRERARLGITQTGVSRVGEFQSGVVANQKEFDVIFYPDFIRRLQDATGLLRKTIIKVISESGRIGDFYVNPEVFIKQVSSVLTTVKKTNIVEGLKYYQSDEFFIVEDVFEEEIEAYLSKTLKVDVSKESNLYDHVIFDSAIEKIFAQKADGDDDVRLFAKLPKKFYIDTPFGKYNPDWIVVIQNNDGDKLYFVAETKGSIDEDDRRKGEQNKIISGKKHFDVLQSDVRYEVIDDFSQLKL